MKRLMRVMGLCSLLLLSVLNLKAQSQIISGPSSKPPKRPPSPSTKRPPSRSASSSTTITVGGVSFKMIRVEGGTFTMGATNEQDEEYVCDDELPTHSVTLSSYYIGETEVTQALWEAVMGDNPSTHPGANLPVEEVSWEDCQDFISKLNGLTGKTFRLPTEAEWEFAAKGGNRSRGYKYSGSNRLNGVAWCVTNSNEVTHRVKTKLPNELGIYDMSGNVSEWCSDGYGEYSSDPQINPTVSGEPLVARGGCFNDRDEYCRTTYRSALFGGVTGDNLGFRLALSTSR